LRPRRAEVERPVEGIRRIRRRRPASPPPRLAPLRRRVDIDDGRIDPLDDVREVDDRGGRRRRVRRGPRVDRLRRSRHDRRTVQPACENGADKESDDGGERERDEGEAARHIRCARPEAARYAPFIISALNASSSSTSTPSWRAFSSLVPASPPATTYVVFLLTELATRAPSRSIAAAASSRVIDASVPVRTNTFPASGPASSAPGG